MIDAPAMTDECCKLTAENLEKMIAIGIVGPGQNGLMHLATTFAAVTALSATVDSMKVEGKLMLVDMITSYLVRTFELDAAEVIQSLARILNKASTMNTEDIDE